MTRPDIYIIEAYEDEPLKMDELQYLQEDHVKELTEHINVTMVDAALSDFQHIIASDEIDLAMLDTRCHNESAC